jgi:hypothetical protein
MANDEARDTLVGERRFDMPFERLSKTVASASLHDESSENALKITRRTGSASSPRRGTQMVMRGQFAIDRGKFGELPYEAPPAHQFHDFGLYRRNLAISIAESPNLWRKIGSKKASL